MRRDGRNEREKTRRFFRLSPGSPTHYSYEDRKRRDARRRHEIPELSRGLIFFFYITSVSVRELVDTGCEAGGCRL